MLFAPILVLRSFFCMSNFVFVLISNFFFHFVYPLVNLSILKEKFLISPRVNVNYIKNLAEELSLVVLVPSLRFTSERQIISRGRSVRTT